MTESVFTELAPAPAAGRVYETDAVPGVADAGGDRRIRIDAIARWLTDLAHADLRDAGFREQGVWVIRRMRVRVEEFPRWPHGFRMRTFCTGLGRFTAERRTSSDGGVGRVAAVTLWVWLDAEQLRPKRFPADFVEVYAEGTNGRHPHTRLRHPDPPDGAQRRPWVFRATDMDVAAHVNNSHYWAPVEEELVGRDVGVFDAEIEFRDPAWPGEMAVVADGPNRWITSPEGTVHASIVLGEPT